jgi:Spy/CpxP family protein refolding chaperone
MRKLLILAGLAALVMAAGTALMAADTAAPAPAAPKEGKAVVAPHQGFGERLGLTQEQKDQIKAILTKARTDAKAALDKAREIRKTAFEEIKTKVLTDEQRQKLADIKEQFKERFHRGGWRGHCGGGVGAVTPKAPLAPKAPAR